MNDRLQDTTGSTERSLFTHPVESEESKSNLSLKIWPKEKKEIKWNFFFAYLFKTYVLKILLYPAILTLIILKLCWNQNHLKSLLTKYFPGIHPKLLSQILGGVLWFLSALQSIKWAGFSSMDELWCSTMKWVLHLILAKRPRSDEVSF